MNPLDWIVQVIPYAGQYPQLAAGLVGVLMSLAATQILKYLIPSKWSDADYKHCVRVLGVLTGWFFGYGAWRLLDPKVGELGDFYWAIGIGFLSPTVYSLIVPLLVAKWPVLDKLLSGRPNGPNT